MDGLPDDVLISIVSLLPVKEAVMSGVLARRWRHFWVCNRVLEYGFDDELEDDIIDPHRPKYSEGLCLAHENSEDRWLAMIRRWHSSKYIRREMEFQVLPMMKKLVLRFNVKVMGEGKIRQEIRAVMNVATLLREMVLMLIGGVPDSFKSRRRLLDLRHIQDGFLKMDMKEHECLKVLEIIGGDGVALTEEITLYVAEYCAASSIEKVVIDGVPYTGEALHHLKKKLLAKVVAAVEC